MKLEKSLAFLYDLTCNNNKEWFTKNKSLYLEAKAEFELFTEKLVDIAKKVDDTINVENHKKCIYRIYRDVRFSKNKQPYKNNFGAFINKDGKKSPFSGYYLHLEPDNSFIAAGTFPDPKHLFEIRNHIYQHSTEFKKILSNSRFKNYFEELLQGEKLKRAPKGFPNDFEDVDLLKYKHYAVTYKVEDEFWLSNNLFHKLETIFNVAKPFNMFINKSFG